MRISTLIETLAEKEFVGDSSIEIKGLAYDSREVKPGFLFAAVHGTHQDGHQFIPQALQSGAAALLVNTSDLAYKVPQIVVKDARRALAVLANRFYDNPTKKLKLVGVTGTNGKTTTTYLIESIFRGVGHKTGVIGTIQYKIGDRVLPAKNTTPESLDLFSLFHEMVKEGVSGVTMEVSSHALDQGRIHGIEFDVVVFTNLTQDHLDYHKTMEAYFQAKSKLFTELPLSKNPKAVINADDSYGKMLIQKTKIPVVTYGVNEGDVRATEVKLGWGGISFTVNTKLGSLPIKLKLSGGFNVYNALAALATGIVLDIPLEHVVKFLEKAEFVRGRFELVQKGQDFGVVIDYAHTPDGLENILRSARELTPGNLITVFGCGGDRDRKKRPIMGEIAEKYSNKVIVTSDNPRTEEPLAIIKEIEVGMKKPHQVEPDRKKAIEMALSMAGARDSVVVAGKGHETYQILKDKTIHFDDREIIENFLGNCGATQSSRNS